MCTILHDGFVSMCILIINIAVVYPVNKAVFQWENDIQNSLKKKNDKKGKAARTSRQFWLYYDFDDIHK